MSPMVLPLLSASLAAADEGGMFRVFTPLFSDIDRLTAEFAGNASARVMTAITPVIQASLVLWFIWWGITVMRGKAHQPIFELLWKMVRTSLILSVALGAGYYQSTVADLVRTVPDDLAAAVLGDNPKAYGIDNAEIVIGLRTPGAGALIDAAAGQGIMAGMNAMQTGSILGGGRSCACTILGVLLLLATAVMVAVGGANIVAAKVVLAVLVALGPLFIASLLFESTRRFFERWVAMVVTYGLVIVLFAVVFSFMLGVFGYYVSQIQFDGQQNVGYAVVGALVLSGVSIMTLWEAKVVAMGLGGGMAMPRWVHAGGFGRLFRGRGGGRHDRDQSGSGGAGGDSPRPPPHPRPGGDRGGGPTSRGGGAVPRARVTRAEGSGAASASGTDGARGADSAVRTGGRTASSRAATAGRAAEPPQAEQGVASETEVKEGGRGGGSARQFRVRDGAAGEGTGHVPASSGEQGGPARGRRVG